MKELKSFKALSDAFKVSLSSAREDIQATLKSNARKIAEELNARLEDDEDGSGGTATPSIAGASSDGDDAVSDATPAAETETPPLIQYLLRGDAFVIGSDDDGVAEREVGSGAISPRPILGPALLQAIPEIEKQIGESLTATLAGET